MPQEVESHCGSGTQLPSLGPHARKGKKGHWEPGVPGAGGETDQLLPTQPGVVGRKNVVSRGQLGIQDAPNPGYPTPGKWRGA